jgi:hypothetical protein
MRFALAVVALSLTLFLVSGSADAAAKKKKKASVVAGTVVSVDSGAGKVTVKTKGNKKKMTPGEEVTVSITKDTKIERVQGKKGSQQRTTAALSDVKQGSAILVRTNAGTQREAASVEIKGKKKKKNT